MCKCVVCGLGSGVMVGHYHSQQSVSDYIEIHHSYNYACIAGVPPLYNNEVTSSMLLQFTRSV